MMFGCGEDPIDLTPTTPPPVDMGGMAPVLVDSGQTPVPDMGITAMLYPDEESFELEVLPILIAQCGAGCHLGTIDLDNNNSPGGNDYEVLSEDVQGSIAEILHPSFSNPGNPASSEVLVHHGGMYFRTLEEKRLVRDWIADTTLPKGEGPTNTGTSELTCDHLPSGDGIGPNGWFAEFEAEINPMLVGTTEEPEGYCSGSGCHTDVRPGNSLNLLPITDPCSARWNFLVSQSFITLESVSASPLLRQPLGEPSLDPNVNTHGGREVFKGEDANYLLLKQWITLLTL